jgi:hypothetical protein
VDELVGLVECLHQEGLFVARQVVLMGRGLERLAVGLFVSENPPKACSNFASAARGDKWDLPGAIGRGRSRFAGNIRTINFLAKRLWHRVG